MPWTKEYLVEATGVTASYYNFISINYDHRSGQSEIIYGVWFSADAYTDGLSPVKQFSLPVPSGTSPTLASGALAFATAYILAQPEFDGAEVVE